MNEAPLTKCTKIDLFFQRLNAGIPGYSVADLEDYVAWCRGHSVFIDFDVTTDDLLCSPCEVGDLPCKVKYANGTRSLTRIKNTGRSMFYINMPGPGHFIQLQTHVLVRAWLNYAEAKERMGADNVVPSDWQFKEGNEVHHQCNKGHLGCFSIFHLLEVDRTFNEKHKNCISLVICPACKIKIRVCPEEDPDKRCMNNLYKHCSNCKPSDYPTRAEPGPQPSTPLAPDRTIMSPGGATKKRPRNS